MRLFYPLHFQKTHISGFFGGFFGAPGVSGVPYLSQIFVRKKAKEVDLSPIHHKYFESDKFWKFFKAIFFFNSGFDSGRCLKDRNLHREIWNFSNSFLNVWWPHDSVMKVVLTWIMCFLKIFENTYGEEFAIVKEAKKGSIIVVFKNYSKFKGSWTQLPKLEFCPI